MGNLTDHPLQPEIPPADTNQEGSSLRRSPDTLPLWEVIMLAVGDCLLLFLFAAIGRASHGVQSPQGPLIGTFNTAVPFMLAWLVIGALVGAYSGKALYPARRVVGRTLLTGLLAGPLGVLLRAAAIAAPVLSNLRIKPAFVLVATGFSTAMLLAWRLIWSRVRRLWWPELP